MAAPDDALRRIDALIGAAMRLAGSAPSGRIALAKAASALEPEWLPRRWRDAIWNELEAARAAAAEPIAFSDVERVLREAWDAPPTDALDELDPEPVAVTPTSQVHRGVLDGEPVAIKVLRPGLSGLVRQDLALLEGLASPLKAAFPGIDPSAIVREVRERVLDELDLEHEATIQRRFHRGLRGHPFLVVPAPVTRLSHEGVLVSQWIDGIPLAQAPDADTAAARLVVFVLGGLRAGIVHADLDPDDVLVLRDGRIAVLDYGATRTVEGERADAALALVEAFAAQDAGGLGAALERLGALPAEHGETALGLATHALGELGEAGASRLDSRAVLGAGRRAASRSDTVIELLLAGSLPPEDLWPLRGVGLLFGTIARIGATADWRGLTLAALRDGWAAPA